MEGYLMMLNPIELALMKRNGGSTDWNTMKNRPFGTEIGMVEVLGETTVELDHEGDDYSGTGVMATIDLVAGKTYVVAYNGMDYECVCREFVYESPMYVLGNFKLVDGNDTGEPFCISYRAELGGFEFIVFDGSTTVTLSIHTEGEVVKKISGKYVEGMGYTEIGEILPETTLTAVSEESPQMFIESLTVEAGLTYTVTINGVPYTHKAIDATELAGLPAVYLGNPAFMGGDTDQESDGTPYMLMYAPDMIAAEAGLTATAMLMVRDFETGDFISEATVSIEGEVVKPIDAKYLPVETVCRMVVNFRGNENGEIVADKTLEQIQESVSAGCEVTGTYSEDLGESQDLTIYLKLGAYMRNDNSNVFGYYFNGKHSKMDIVIFYANEGIAQM